jgi:hypothetical protein
MINLKTAKARGLGVPLLARANRIANGRLW